MDYIWNEPARPVDFKESTVVAALKKTDLLTMPKADGVRLHIVVNDQGRVFLRSRANLPFPGLQGLEDRLNWDDTKNLRYALQGMTIEGEAVLVNPDGTLAPCEVTSGTLQRKDQLKIGGLYFYHFDTTAPETMRVGKQQRMLRGRNTVMALVSHGMSYRMLPTMIAGSLEDLWKLYHHARALGFEGLVAVKPEEPYANGKKVGAGWKVKPAITVEGHITGFNEAFSENGWALGRVGSFNVDYEDGTKGEAGAGALTHDQRKYIWENPGEFQGRIAEFKAMEKFAKGGYRHPNFVRWRDSEEHKGVKQ